MACCCQKRREDATINIRWEVGGGGVTKGGFEVVVLDLHPLAERIPAKAAKHLKLKSYLVTRFLIGNKKRETRRSR